MKHGLFVLLLLFACMSVRSKVFLVETKDVPSENNQLDSRGISLNVQCAIVFMYYMINRYILSIFRQRRTFAREILGV